MAEPDSLESRTVLNCLDKLKLTLKKDTDLALFLYQKGFILQPVYDVVLDPVSVFTDDDKAEKLLCCIRNEIKMSSEKYHQLVKQLRRNLPRYGTIVRILDQEFQRLGGKNAEDSEIDYLYPFQHVLFSSLKQLHSRLRPPALSLQLRSQDTATFSKDSEGSTIEKGVPSYSNYPFQHVLFSSLKQPHSRLRPPSLYPAKRLQEVNKNEELTWLREEFSKLQRDMAAKVEELAQLREASKLPRDMAAKDEPLAQLREDFIKLQREIAAKDESLARLMEEFRKLQRDMAAKSEEVALLMKEFSKLPRDMAAKDEPLAQLMEEFRKLQRDMAAKDESLARLMEEFRKLQRDMAAKSEEVALLMKEFSKLPRDMAAKDEPLAQLMEEFSKLQRDMAAKDEPLAQLMEEFRKLHKDIAAKDKLRSSHLLGSPKEGRQVLGPLNMKWASGIGMPFAMTGSIQSVAVLGTLYVGGGSVGLNSDNDFIVMAYDILSSCNWRRLPHYRARSFAMAVLNNQLVLVGGRDRRNTATNLVGVWGAESREWIHPYPPMPTARSWSSAVAYQQWLLVAGGESYGGYVSTVEVLDVASLQWWSAPSTPTPLCGMRSTIVGDMWYLMGGYGGGYGNTDEVYSESLPALISHCNSSSSSNTSSHMWNIIFGQRLYSTPLSIGGSLLAVGGMSGKDEKVVSAIHRYLPETEEWVVVGELPSPLYHCTCAVSSAGEVLVAGGRATNLELSSRVYVGNLM